MATLPSQVMGRLSVKSIYMNYMEASGYTAFPSLRGCQVNSYILTIWRQVATLPSPGLGWLSGKFIYMNYMEASGYTDISRLGVAVR